MEGTRVSELFYKRIQIKKMFGVGIRAGWGLEEMNFLTKNPELIFFFWGGGGGRGEGEGGARVSEFFLIRIQI